MKKNYDKLYKKACSKKSKQLSDYAYWVTDTYCTTIENGKLEGASRKNVQNAIYYDFLISSEFVKTKYLLTGVAIGCISSAAFMLLLKLKKDKES